MPSPGDGSPVGGAISGVNSGLRLTPRLCAEGLTSVSAAAAATGTSGYVIDFAMSVTICGSRLDHRSVY